MASAVITGAEVSAASEIDESDFLAEGEVHIHARRGESGVVRVVDGEWLTVTWRRTGTTTDCHLSELVVLERRPEPIFLTLTA